MFYRILQWLREVIDKMLNQSNVKQAMNVDVAISTQMGEALLLWSQMYENLAPWLTKDIRSLNLAAAIAGEISRAATIELKVTIDGSPRAKYLAEQFALVQDKLREQVEKGCAKGGLMMKPFVNGDQVLVDFVQADQFYPVAFDANGNITSCIFSDQRTIGDKFYTRLEFHQMVESEAEGKKIKGCIIRNLAFKSSSRDTLGTQITLAVIPAWANLEPEATITNIEKPLYAYFKFPLANNIDSTSPLGVSCYSRAANLIEDADKIWSNLLWEFESGKRAIYVDILAFDKDVNNKPILPDRRLYRTLNMSGNADDEDLFEEWSPEFREASITSGLDTILKKIEYNCGLAYGTLSDPQSIEKTATELKMSKQRSYATITDTQKALQDALEQLLWAMDTWCTIAKLAPMGSYTTVYDFDDSVVTDKDLQFQQDIRLVTAGLMSKWEFRMRNFGEDEKTAKQRIADVQTETPPESVFGGAQ
jgi:A118 family predicted phage portal protein